MLQGCPKLLEAMVLIFRMTKACSLMAQVHWRMPLNESGND